MNLKTITMPVEEARAKAREYRAAFKRSRSAEDEAIWRGSKALAQGHDLVDVAEAVKAGGEDGSMGYRTGHLYELRFIDSDEYPVVIERLDGSGRCPYASMRAFLDNWDLGPPQASDDDGSAD